MKISIQTGGLTDRFGMEKGYAMIKAAGFDAVDWSLDDHLESSQIYAGEYWYSLFDKPLDEILAALAPEFALQRKYGLTVTQAHAPFPAYTLSRPAVYEYIPSVYEKCAHICAVADCKNLVIHGINHLPTDTTHTAEYIDRLNWQLFSGLIPVLKETGVRVCLENQFGRGKSSRGADFMEGHCSNPQEAMRMIDALNEEAGEECFGLCLDTGHLNLMHIDPRVYIPMLGNRIKALHIHDNDGQNDQHQTPYNGNICWQHYLSALRDIGYEGDLSFETFGQLHYINEDALIPSQLQAISAVGNLFRQRIQEK